MDFVEYLLSRHLTVKGAKQIRQKSAAQYNGRLENMKSKNIYNGEDHLTLHIVNKIKDNYVSAAGEYERTIKYYLEYKRS